MKKNTFNTLNVVTCAMLSALAVILASSVHFFSGGDTTVASLISPMHFPIFLAGILCGQWLGLISGAMAPLVSFVANGRPPFPNGLIPMIFELAAYGFLTGLFRKLFLKNSKTAKFASVIALVLAMIAGRIVNALLFATVTAIGGAPFFAGFATQIVKNFINTWVGIIAQLVLIPAILIALQKSGVLLKYLPDSPTVKPTQAQPHEDTSQETAQPLIASAQSDTTEQEK